MTPSKIPTLREKIFARLSNKDLAELSALELDLLMQQVRELYDELDALRNERARQLTPPKVEILPKREVILPPAEEKVIVQPPAVKQEVKQKPAIEQPVDKIVPETASTHVKETSSRPAAVSINERIDTATTLNEKLKTGTSVTEVHRKLSSKPLKNLIDLNKKHVLLHELFGGSAINYSNAIDEIDACADYTSAQNHFHSQLSAYNWDENNQAVRMFARLVKQKFGVE